MKSSWKRLKQHMPWFLLLLGVDGFAALLLWFANAEAFRVLIAVILLATVLLFTAVCRAVIRREQDRERAFLAFLDTPDEYHEAQLLKTAGDAWTEAICQMGTVLRENKNAYNQLQLQAQDYEEYVEAWTHETKIPLSLLAILLDNRRSEFSETVGFKLDYVRSRMQESVDQMLFYARINGMRKDYLFEYVNVRECIEKVLDEYRPLLEEKEFLVNMPVRKGLVYTDERGFHFLLAQLVSNAIKYSGEDPEIYFILEQGEQECRLRVQDNGIGVKSCDLPYIFEKGFTGGAGEDRKKATGMGLYLAKAIARELNLSLEAASEWGKGFEIIIGFPVV